MAQLRGTVRGNRGEASRLGHRTMTATVNGWNIGVTVNAYVEDGEVRFNIWATGGSLNKRSSRLLATLSQKEDDLYWLTNQ